MTNEKDSEMGEEGTCRKKLGECRICQEEEDESKLEAPCACSGSVKYAHRQCVQRWCDEKGHTVCEICCQPYRDGYRVLSRPRLFISRLIERRETFAARNSALGSLNDSEEEEEEEYNDINELNSATAACCRSAAFALLVVVLELHTLIIASAATSGEHSVLCFLIFAVRTAGLLLPCYVLARALRSLHCNRDLDLQVSELELSEYMVMGCANS
eukprot:TRINITY_DN934_c0_g1_i3.p1 TRINITY_DN934_c0_g1~~TRINITY_DN934_c0_g1_i3.p1  ORF type:complete len:214 (-),score=34.73 TRINITY_DN934_c0_g1_i3:364-1005(-)